MRQTSGRTCAASRSGATSVGSRVWRLSQERVCADSGRREGLTRWHGIGHQGDGRTRTTRTRGGGAGKMRKGGRSMDGRDQQRWGEGRKRRERRRTRKRRKRRGTKRRAYCVCHHQRAIVPSLLLFVFAGCTLTSRIGDTPAFCVSSRMQIGHMLSTGAHLSQIAAGRGMSKTNWSDRVA